MKVRGRRWLCRMLLVPRPWAGRAWALLSLTILVPSARHDRAAGRRHKELTDRARQALLLLRLWLPGRAPGIVADSGYAASEVLARCARLADPLAVAARLRLDAALYAPVAPSGKKWVTLRWTKVVASMLIGPPPPCRGAPRVWWRALPL